MRPWDRTTRPCGGNRRQTRHRTGFGVPLKKGNTESPEPQPQAPCDKCGKDFVHYRVEMENLGLATLVEVEARIRLVRKNDTLGTRKPVSADLEKLLARRGNHVGH